MFDIGQIFSQAFVHLSDSVQPCDSVECFMACGFDEDILLAFPRVDEKELYLRVNHAKLFDEFVGFPQEIFELVLEFDLSNR
jgi:hypothetical protein